MTSAEQPRGSLSDVHHASPLESRPAKSNQEFHLRRCFSNGEDLGACFLLSPLPICIPTSTSLPFLHSSTYSISRHIPSSRFPGSAAFVRTGNGRKERHPRPYGAAARLPDGPSPAGHTMPCPGGWQAGGS